MKISLVHPSKGRPQMAIDTANKWLNRAKNRKNIEYIFSLDTDDTTLFDYVELINDSKGLRLTINENICLVEAANNGVSKSTGDLIVLVSDDFDCPEGWDESLTELITDNNYPCAILIDDGICTAGDILSLPIINRALYERLGYIYHPDFFSLFADNALLEVAKKLNCLIDARYLLFQHLHYTVGLSKNDATYQHENSTYAYEMGKIAIEKLRLRNYDL